MTKKRNTLGSMNAQYIGIFGGGAGNGEALSNNEIDLVSDRSKVNFDGGVYVVKDYQPKNRMIFEGNSAPFYNIQGVETNFEGTTLKADDGASSVLDLSNTFHFLVNNVILDGNKKTAIGFKTGGDGINGGSLTAYDAVATFCSIGFGQENGASDSVVTVNCVARNNLKGMMRQQDSVHIGFRAISNDICGIDLQGSSSGNFIQARTPFNGKVSTPNGGSDGCNIVSTANTRNWVQMLYNDHAFNSGLRCNNVSNSIYEGIFYRNGKHDNLKFDGNCHIHNKGGLGLLFRFVSSYGKEDNGTGTDTPKTIVNHDASIPVQGVEYYGDWSGYTVKPFNIVAGELDERTSIKGPNKPHIWRKSAKIKAGTNYTFTAYFPRLWETETAISGQLFLSFMNNDNKADRTRRVIDWQIDNFETVTKVTKLGEADLPTANTGFNVTLSNPVEEGQWTKVDVNVINNNAWGCFVFMQLFNPYHV